jgi:hypothetical protein
MSHLTEIERRRGKDRWKDAGFVLIAGLLIALSIGAVTTRAARKPLEPVWTLTVTEGPIEIAK